MKTATRRKSVREKIKSSTGVNTLISLGIVAVLILSGFGGISGARSSLETTDVISSTNGTGNRDLNVYSPLSVSDSKSVPNGEKNIEHPVPRPLPEDGGGMVSDKEGTMVPRTPEKVTLNLSEDLNDSCGGQPLRSEGATATGLVYVVVAGNIYSEVLENVTHYKTDVETLGYTVEIIQWDETGPGITNASLLRHLLYDAYVNHSLIGALFVGDIPYVKSNYNGYATLTDFYFWDLDGVWLDTDGDGVFDAGMGARSLDIWIGSAHGITAQPAVCRRSNKSP